MSGSASRWTKIVCGATGMSLGCRAAGSREWDKFRRRAMAYRRKVICLRLCRALIAANSAERRKRLKGSLFIRSRAVRRANDLIAILHAAGDGREWARSKVDTVCSDLRKQAADSRLSADVRLKAIERLMALDGLLGLDE